MRNEIRRQGMLVKLKDMQPGLPYVVVKGGTTLMVGDHVKLEEADRALLCREVAGWLEYDQWKYLRNMVELDTATIDRRIAVKKAEIGELRSILPEDVKS